MLVCGDESTVCSSLCNDVNVRSTSYVTHEVYACIFLFFEHQCGTFHPTSPLNRGSTLFLLES